MRRHHRLALLAPTLLAACTQADLVPLERPELYERQNIEAEVCAPDASEEAVPYKILFVIDTSFSNSWNDPDGRREQAVRRAISGLLPIETVSFGIITFADEPRRQTYGFTRDLDVLNGATANVSNAEGRTNYSDTLWAVIGFIQDDVATLSPALAARTHYLVYWLSDGYPTVGVTEPAALTPAMTYLTEQLGDQVAELRFNTAYLGTAPDAQQYSAGEEAQAVALLTALAEQGNGAFSSIPTGEDFDFDIQLAPVLARFSFAFAVASNLHTRDGVDGPEPDSDGDGLADALELQHGLDPGLADSDGDGYRDGVEWRVPSRLHPLRADEGCSSDEKDGDRDGLLDCEETASGTLLASADSDGDQLQDGAELFGGLDPVQADALYDDDLDGVLNQDELRMHLDPARANDGAAQEAWAYRYSVDELPAASAEAPPCYRLRIENLTMTQTRPDGVHPTGGNLIDVRVAFRGNGTLRFVQAQLRGRVVRDSDLWDPADGRFVLRPQDFVPTW
jgi:hypothetical protein